MSFVKKTWKDRLSAFPKRWKIKFEGSSEIQTAELELDDGTVITQGDRFNASSMNDLEQRIEDAFSAAGGVASFNSRTGAVVPGSTDYTSDMIAHTNSDSSVTTVQDAINGIKSGSVDSSQLRSGGSTGTNFYFDYQGGKYGWNSSSARGANTFHPFKQPVTDTKTITSKTTTDLGEDHTYRYIDTTGVVNTNSGTYTASSRGAALDMGASNSYRYVNTNGVPNSNSGTYTFPAGDGGDTKDLGASNSYRYVNARNVYFQGVNDGRGTLFFENYNFEMSASSHESDYVTSTTSVNVGQNGRTVKAAYLASIYCRSQSRYIASLYNASVSLSGNTATVSVTIQGAQVSADGTHIFGGQIGVVYI